MDTPAYLHLVAQAEEATARDDFSTAAGLWHDVTDVNPTGGYLWYRLGQAEYESGRYEAALTAFEQAGERGVCHRRPQFVRLPAELALDIARCHARLGNREAAIESITAAVELGLYDLNELSDDVFKDVADDRRFRQLTMPSAPAERNAGWRTDLTLLTAEILRRSPVAHRYGNDVARASTELERRIPVLSDARIVAEFHRILALLGDGHAFITTTQPELPLRLFRFEETVVVIAAPPRLAHLIGGELTAVDDRPVDDVLAELEPLVARDNRQQLLNDGTTRLRDIATLHALGLTERPDRAVIDVTGPTGVQRVTVHTVDVPAPSRMNRFRPDGWVWLPEKAKRTPLHLARLAEPYWYEYLPDHDLFYFGFNSVVEDGKSPLPSFFADMFDHFDEVKPYRFVVDVRWNGGGNTFKALELLNRVLARPDLNRPDRLFVITGRNTFSAAQNTVTTLWLHTDATFVGEPTGSSPNFTGEVVGFQLPHSGLTANVSDLHWQTSVPLDHRTWIEPDLYAPPRLSDWLAGHDPALAAITRYPRRDGSDA